jgi:hypothetical protein
MDPAYLARIIAEYDLDYVCHGDDPCLTPEGDDVYVGVVWPNEWQWLGGCGTVG